MNAFRALNFPFEVRILDAGFTRSLKLVGACAEAQAAGGVRASSARR